MVDAAQFSARRFPLSRLEIYATRTSSSCLSSDTISASVLRLLQLNSHCTLCGWSQKMLLWMVIIIMDGWMPQLLRPSLLFCRQLVVSLRLRSLCALPLSFTELLIAHCWIQNHSLLVLICTKAEQKWRLPGPVMPLACVLLSSSSVLLAVMELITGWVPATRMVLGEKKHAHPLYSTGKFFLKSRVFSSFVTE